MPTERLHIAVLLGGPSAERSVSLHSGAAVAAALESRGHIVRRIDPNPRLGEGVPLGTSELIAEAAWTLEGGDWRGIDIVFNALHGPFGEDGQAQRLLDALGVPYTGSDAVASRDGFHKSLAKERFQTAGVPTPRGIVCRSDEKAERIQLAADTLGYPLVVKPDAQGSSLGVSIVRSSADLMAALERCFTYGPNVLVEEYITGTEWTVPVWDDEVLPIIQILAAEAFYDFHAKYSDNRTEYRFDFDVPPAVVQSFAAAGRKAARALRTRGLARVDVRVTNDGRPFVLEVNTSPGMTDHSLVPKSAARYGLTLGELCEQDCRRALQRRHGRRRRSA
jgi:D-alanine-D-alanine ligase